MTNSTASTPNKKFTPIKKVAASSWGKPYKHGDDSSSRLLAHLKCMDTYESPTKESSSAETAGHHPTTPISKVYLDFREVRKELIDKRRLSVVLDEQKNGEIQLYVPPEQHQHSILRRQSPHHTLVPYDSTSPSTPTSGGGTMVVADNSDSEQKTSPNKDDRMQKNWRRDTSLKHIDGYIDEDFIFQPNNSIMKKKLKKLRYQNQPIVDDDGDVFFDGSQDGNSSTQFYEGGVYGDEIYGSDDEEEEMDIPISTPFKYDNSIDLPPSDYKEREEQPVREIASPLQQQLFSFAPAAFQPQQPSTASLFSPAVINEEMVTTDTIERTQIQAPSEEPDMDVQQEQGPSNADANWIRDGDDRVVNDNDGDGHHDELVFDNDPVGALAHDDNSSIDDIDLVSETDEVTAEDDYEAWLASQQQRQEQQQQVDEVDTGGQEFTTEHDDLVGVGIDHGSNDFEETDEDLNTYDEVANTSIEQSFQETDEDIQSYDAHSNEEIEEKSFEETDEDIVNLEDVIRRIESIDKGDEDAKGEAAAEDIAYSPQDALDATSQSIVNEDAAFSTVIGGEEAPTEDDQTETEDSYERWLASQIECDKPDEMIEDNDDGSPQLDDDAGKTNEQEDPAQLSDICSTDDFSPALDDNARSTIELEDHAQVSNNDATDDIPLVLNADARSTNGQQDAEQRPNIDPTAVQAEPETELVPPEHSSEVIVSDLAKPEASDKHGPGEPSHQYEEPSEESTGMSTLDILADAATALPQKSNVDVEPSDTDDTKIAIDSTPVVAQAASEDSYESWLASQMEQNEPREACKVDSEDGKADESDQVIQEQRVSEPNEVFTENDTVNVGQSVSCRASLSTESAAEVTVPDKDELDKLPSTIGEVLHDEKSPERTVPLEDLPSGLSTATEKLSEVEQIEATDSHSHDDESEADEDNTAKQEGNMVAPIPKPNSEGLTRPKIPSPRHILWDESEIRYDGIEDCGRQLTNLIDIDTGVIDDQFDPGSDMGIRKPKIPTPTYMFSGGGRIAVGPGQISSQILPTTPSPVVMLTETAPLSSEDNQHLDALNTTGVVTDTEIEKQGLSIEAVKPSVPSPRTLLAQSNEPAVGRELDSSIVPETGLRLTNPPSPRRMLLGKVRGCRQLDTAIDGESPSDDREPTAGQSNAMSPRKTTTGALGGGTPSGEAKETPDQKPARTPLGSDAKSQERDAAWQSLSAKWNSKKSSDAILSDSALKAMRERSSNSTPNPERQAAEQASPVSSLSLSSGSRTEDDFQLASYHLVIPPLEGGVATSNTSSSGTMNFSEDSADVGARGRHLGEENIGQNVSGSAPTDTPDRKPSTPKYANHPFVYPDKAPMLATEVRAKSRRSEDVPSTPHRVESTKSPPGSNQRSARSDGKSDSGVALRTEARAKARASGIPSIRKKGKTPTPTRAPKTPPRPLVLPDNAPDLETASRAQQRASNPPSGSASPAAVPASINLFPLGERRMEMFLKQRQFSEECKNKFEASLHQTVAPCDRCWSLASPEERTKYQKRGSHLNIMRTRSGCGPNCKIFPFFSKEEPVRLCLKCFLATHQKRQKIQVFRGNHKKIMPIS